MGLLGDYLFTLFSLLFLLVLLLYCHQFFVGTFSIFIHVEVKYLLQMLLFGSFTEDETKSWFTQSSGNTETKTFDKKVSQDDSSKSAPELSFGSFSTASIMKPDSSKGQESRSTHEERARGVKPVADISSGVLQQNGGIPNAITNGNEGSPVVKNVNITSLCISENQNKASSQFHKATCSDLSSNGENSNGMINDSARMPHSEDLKASDGPPYIGDLLPRGLINSGNLCFLNATVQALLSCTPFVEILQRLRVRNISKVCSFNICPSLHELSIGQEVILTLIVCIG